MGLDGRLYANDLFFLNSPSSPEWARLQQQSTGQAEGSTIIGEVARVRGVLYFVPANPFQACALSVPR